MSEKPHPFGLLKPARRSTEAVLKEAKAFAALATDAELFECVSQLRAEQMKFMVALSEALKAEEAMNERLTFLHQALAYRHSDARTTQ